MSERSVSPLVGVVLMVAITVVLATTVGAGLTAMSAPEPAPRAQLSASADAGTDRVTVTHHGGDSLDVEALSVQIVVDGEPLASQPPVPFFAAEGFESGPTGPFNSATDGAWSAGQTAGLRLAGTNAPLLTPGDTVEITITREDATVAVLETVA